MTIHLLRAGDGVVSYHDGDDIDRVLSPRPFLTATTPGGVPVTDVGPDDHRHHFGLSAAAPDVSGVSFWGGRTYVDGIGSTLLDNHGAQRVTHRDLQGGTLTEEIDWHGRDGAPLLHEDRVVTVEAREAMWVVSWVSRLTATAGDVSFGSPQTNGRPGAFYGGLFWRTPFPSAKVRCADGDGVGAAHGSRSHWLAVEGPDATLVAVTTDDLPWFVRAEGYVGFGPALATSERRRLDAGATLDLHLTVALLDGQAAEPESIVDAVLAAPAR